MILILSAGDLSLSPRTTLDEILGPPFPDGAGNAEETNVTSTINTERMVMVIVGSLGTDVRLQVEKERAGPEGERKMEGWRFGPSQTFIRVLGTKMLKLFAVV